VVFTLESLCDGFGVVPVASHRVPPAPFSAGERVKAVVGNDVEAVLALLDVAHRGGTSRRGGTSGRAPAEDHGDAVGGGVYVCNFELGGCPDVDVGGCFAVGEA
jgi:hypothetical protein